MRLHEPRDGILRFSQHQLYSNVSQPIFERRYETGEGLVLRPPRCLDELSELSGDIRDRRRLAAYGVHAFNNRARPALDQTLAGILSDASVL